MRKYCSGDRAETILEIQDERREDEKAREVRVSGEGRLEVALGER